MATTPRGLYKPDGSTVADIEAIVGELADTADAAIEAVAGLLGGLKIQRGTFILSVDDTDSPITVTFPVPFSAAPRVSCDPMLLGLAGLIEDIRWGHGSASGDNASGRGTTTDFRFSARRTAGSPSNIRVEWTAMGPA